MPVETITQAMLVLEWLWIRLLMAMVILAILPFFACLMGVMRLLISNEGKAQQVYIHSVIARPQTETVEFCCQRKDRVITATEWAHQEDWSELNLSILPSMSLDHHQILVDWSQLATMATNLTIYTQSQKS